MTIGLVDATPEQIARTAELVELSKHTFTEDEIELIARALAYCSTLEKHPAVKPEVFIMTAIEYFYQYGLNDETISHAQSFWVDGPD
jgi:hypothetical protein